VTLAVHVTRVEMKEIITKLWFRIPKGHGQIVSL